MFRPFVETPLHKVKVIMFARECHDGVFATADGLAYSTNERISKLSDLPDNLRGLIREARNDVQIRKPHHGNLRRWAQEGVFLWNTIPTRPKFSVGQNSDHLGRWFDLSKEILETVATTNPDTIFVSEYAVPSMYRSLAEGLKLRNLTHANPGSDGFVDSKIFSTINDHLKETSQYPIDWNVQ